MANFTPFRILSAKALPSEERLGEAPKDQAEEDAGALLGLRVEVGGTVPQHRRGAFQAHAFSVCGGVPYLVRRRSGMTPVCDATTASQTEPWRIIPASLTILRSPRVTSGGAAKSQRFIGDARRFPIVPAWGAAAANGHICRVSMPHAQTSPPLPKSLPMRANSLARNSKSKIARSSRIWTVELVPISGMTST